MNAFTLDGPVAFRITGSGSAFPGPVTDGDGKTYEDVTNEDIFRILHGDGWRERCAELGLDPAHPEREVGLKTRKWSHWPALPTDHGETSTADLAVEACRKALDEAGATADDIDVLVLATTSPMQITSSTATRVAAELGLVKPAIEIKAGCSSFLYALVTAAGYLKLGARRVLVAASETLSKFISPAQYIAIFSVADGAGAAVLEAAPDGEAGLVSGMISSDGTLGQIVCTPGLLPPTVEAVQQGAYLFAGDAQKLKEATIEKYGAVFETIFPAAGIAPSALDLYIPHQVNVKLIHACAAQLGLPMEKVFVNIGDHANLGSACLAVALHEARTGGRIKDGDLVGMAVVGGGLTWGGAILRF